MGITIAYWRFLHPLGGRSICTRTGFLRGRRLCASPIGSNNGHRSPNANVGRSRSRCPIAGFLVAPPVVVCDFYFFPTLLHIVF